MNAPLQRELTPADVRCLRQLAVEVRLAIETATLGPHRFRTFGRDALQHARLLVDLAWVVLIDTDHTRLRSLPHWARCELLAARGRRRAWRHRAAHLRDAGKLLLRFEQQARALEGSLWDG